MCIRDRRYVIATHNRKKLLELQRILSPLGIEAVTGEEIGIPLSAVSYTHLDVYKRQAADRTGNPGGQG